MISNSQLPYFLHPSNLVVSKQPQWITTVLGSCVSVCLFDQKQGIGGINHFMLPYWSGDGLESPRYGNVAIPQLIQKMLDFGAKKEDIVAKVFGGADMLGPCDSVFHVGQRNIELAYKLLDEFEIEVLSSSTGGKQGRKILFNTGTGEVLQKYLTKITSNELK